MVPALRRRRRRLAEAVFSRATGGDEKGVTLLAVGGYGRGELAPGSDLDLLLVHDRRGRMKPLADAIWYPVWDTGLHLDHSVRTAKEVRAAMDDDIKVALGLLDALASPATPTWPRRCSVGPWSSGRPGPVVGFRPWTR